MAVKITSPSSSKVGSRNTNHTKQHNLNPSSSSSTSRKLSAHAKSKNAAKRELNEKPVNLEIGIDRSKKLKGPQHHCWKCKQAPDPKRCFGGAKPHYVWCPRHPDVAVSTRGGALQHLCRVCTREDETAQRRAEEDELAAAKKRNDNDREDRRKRRDATK